MSTVECIPRRCPLCGEDNDCGAEQRTGVCWCFAAPIPSHVLERIPPEAKNKACVCQRCCGGTTSSMSDL